MIDKAWDRYEMEELKLFTQFSNIIMTLEKFLNKG